MTPDVSIVLVKTWQRMMRKYEAQTVSVMAQSTSALWFYCYYHLLFRSDHYWFLIFFFPYKFWT